MPDNDIETTNGQYIVFALGREMLAIEIAGLAGVSEVLKNAKITEVPGMPGHLPGVVNLRGNIISVVDISPILGMNPVERKTDICVVIINISRPEHVRMGILANSVLEVFHINAGQIDPPPLLGTGIKNELIKGMAKYGRDYVMILDVDRVTRNIELEATVRGQ